MSASSTGDSNSNSSSSATGTRGETNLAAGEHIAMRKWEKEEPGVRKSVSRRDYETIGYVLKGKAELHLGSQVTMLEAGSSWVVPHGAEHTYKVLETFSAIEVTHPSYRE